MKNTTYFIVFLGTLFCFGCNSENTISFLEGAEVTRIFTNGSEDAYEFILQEESTLGKLANII